MALGLIGDIPTIPLSLLIQIFNLNQAEKLLTIHQRYPNIVALTKKKDFLAVQDVDAIQHILRDNSVAYDKNFSLYDRVKLFLGDGLLLQTGEEWRKRRKLSQPYFTHHSMAHVFAVALDKSEQLVQRWRFYAHQRVVVNLAQELSTVMLQIAAEVLFSTSVSYEEACHLVSVYAKTQRYAHRAISMHRWFPSIAQWRARYGSAQLKKAIEAIVHHHIPQTPPDMLDSLLAATQCPVMNMTKSNVCDELQTFLGGGHETTTSGFLWTMVQVLQHPHYVDLLQKEVDSVFSGRHFFYEDLESLSLTKMIFQEGLRLYPPVWITARRLLESDVLCGYSIPKDTIVTICLYSLHRDLRHWVDPETFNPYRFTPEAIAARHKYAYIPFGAGARGCIAQLFSMTQVSVVLAMLMKHFNCELLSSDFSYDLYFTIRPSYPIYVRVTERG